MNNEDAVGTGDARAGIVPMPFHKRPDRIRDPAKLLDAMRPCREAMTFAMSEVKPFGVHYCGMQTVVAAIDAMARLLGEGEHFWEKGTAPRRDA
ncbi:MAG TPA: hypothetical protein VEK35_01835 [Roseiarcus sp.]|nr:hypothetical protein [Roseiarcus sp.]